MTDPTPVPSDADLIAQSLTEPDLFGAIFDRHAKQAHRFLERRVGVGAADDLLVEVFLAAFRARPRYDTTRQDAAPWILGIARNVIAQHRRAENRHLTLLQAIPAEGDVPDHAEETVNRVLAAGQRERLAGALGRLHRRDRDVLLMIAWEELSYAEVSEALDIPVGTVRSRLNRARRVLRHGLDLPESSPDPTIEELMNQ